MRRRATWIAAAVFALTAMRAFAQTPEATFETACRAYDAGRWDEAAEGFRSLLRLSAGSPERSMGMSAHTS